MMPQQVNAGGFMRLLASAVCPNAKQPPACDETEEHEATAEPAVVSRNLPPRDEWPREPENGQPAVDKAHDDRAFACQLDPRRPPYGFREVVDFL